MDKDMDVFSLKNRGENASEQKEFSLVDTKICGLVGMAVSTIIFAILPLLFVSKLRNNNDPTSQSRWQTTISLLSCFSGGVFIGACFLDLIPDVDKIFQQVLEDVKKEYGITTDFPVVPFIVVVGFMLILIIEQTVLHFQDEKHEPEDEQPIVDASGEVSDNIVPNQRGHQHIHQFESEHSNLRSLLLLLALSFHSVFEGLAIGLQNSKEDMLTIFVAVMMHKAIMAFSLGLNIAQSSFSVKAFIASSLVFSLASPLGVGVGIGLSGLPASIPQRICNGVLQGIAGGTFLYITFFEVLPSELNVPKNRLLKVLFVILGFAVFSALLLALH